MPHQNTARQHARRPKDGQHAVTSTLLCRAHTQDPGYAAMGGRDGRSAVASALPLIGGATVAGIALAATAYLYRRRSQSSSKPCASAPAAAAAARGGAFVPAPDTRPVEPAPAVPADPTATPAFAQLHELFQTRIAMIDGAMGTSIQAFKLEEEDFRAERYKDHPGELKGNNDLLVITRPDVIEQIHLDYLNAGADIIETNTFNGTTTSQADYDLDQVDEVHYINKTAAELAKKCTAKYMAEHPGEVKFVAGAIGPTSKTLSVSPSVEHPEFRGTTYDAVRQAYYEQVRIATHCPEFCGTTYDAVRQAYYEQVRVACNATGGGVLRRGTGAVHRQTSEHSLGVVRQTLAVLGYARCRRSRCTRTASTSSSLRLSFAVRVKFMHSAQAVALHEGGVDLFLVETIFDTLNSKAAIYALEDFFEDYKVRLPVLISGTIVDNSGRTLSGQTNEAFWNSVRHAKPFAIGLNCALGAEDMLPYMRNLSECCDCYVFCYPNAGLPNAMGGYDQTGPEMAEEIQPFCEQVRAALRTIPAAS